MAMAQICEMIMNGAEWLTVNSFRLTYRKESSMVNGQHGLSRTNS